MSETPFYIPSVQTHLIPSKHVDQTFQIQVMQPVMKRGEQERFPVVYITDGSASFDFAKGISHHLQLSGQVQRYIMVSIGYPGDNPFSGSILRARDYSSPRRADPGWPKTSPIEGVWELEEGKKSWHGATDFLAFVRHELIPFIDKTYPTVPGDRAYAGHSLGGGLGLHVLFSHSDLFNRYVIASPSMSYDGDDYGIREAQEFIDSGKRLDARVAMLVAQGEEFEPKMDKVQFVSNFYRLAALLRKAKIPGLDLHSRVIPDETHVSVWPVAFSQGVRAIFGPAERPPTAE